MTLSSSEVLTDLRDFLGGLSGGPPKNRNTESENLTEVVKTATNLLKNFPASREAVLFYFCQVIDDSIKLHLIVQAQNQNEQPSNKKRLEEKLDVVNLIHEALSSLIKWNPKGWAPIISNWSLRLLGQMSSYHTPHLQLSRAKHGLNDTLQIWLACPAMRMLIDLTTSCLEDLNQSETGACINALLETSVEHSPHFDWVVAHIGGCFPHTVVTRVLACGLHDFIMYGTESGNISPKLHSVVGILAHLSFSHAINIQKAVYDLFVTSCTDNIMSEQNVAVMPYLLQLSSLSQDLLDIIIEQGVKSIGPETVPAYIQQSAVWSTKYFGGREGLMNWLVQQVVRSRQGGLPLVNVLLNYGGNKQPQIFLQAITSELFEMLLNEAAQTVQSTGRSVPTEVSLLQCLQPHVSALCLLILTEDSWQQGAILRLLGLMALIQGPAVSIHVTTLLLQKKDPLRMVPLIRRYLKSVQGLHTDVVNAAVHEALKFQGRNLENALLNILQLVGLEKTSRRIDDQIKYNFQSALNTNLELFPGLFFQDGQIPHLAIRLLNKIQMQLHPQDPDSIQLIHPRLVSKLAYCCVPHFFTVLSMRPASDGGIGGAGGFNQKEAQKVLITLSGCPNGQSLVLRLLMQGVFSEEWKTLFGAQVQPLKNSKGKNRSLNSSTSLLVQNRNFCSSVTLPQRHSSVFHAGIIGNGIRNRHPPDGSNVDKSQSPTDVQLDSVRININMLLDTLSQCCSRNPAGMTQLSLLIVEIVSPDVMFNGLIWPDEDFTKVTVERDLHIRRFTQDHAVVWDLLNLMAQHRPALCYCSVLLRALLATLLSYWANCQDKQAKESRDALDMTCRLIELMATGQLLPPPLAYLSEVLAHVSPHEVHILLKDVWAFMRDNVPTPALFGSDRPSAALWRDLSDYRMDPRYTERLRLIMLANIGSVGHLYPRFLAPDKS